jgi:hypothetical protein
MIRTLALSKEKNPALQRIADMLVEAFEQVGERIRKELRDEYRKWAKYRFEQFVEAARTGTGDVYVQTRRGRAFPFSDYHEWSEFKGASHPRMSTWEDIRASIKGFSLTYKHADEKADLAYENARDSFVHKNLDKLREVIGKRQDLENAVTKFDLKRGALDGNVQVYLKGAYFRAEVGLKYVVRTIPNLTPYFQYPLVFVEAEVGGQHYARPSEEELRVLLGGVSRKQLEAEISARAAEEGWCPQSGQPVPEKLYRPVASRMSPYVRCHACGTVASAQRGVYRKHKTPAATKGEAASKLETAGYCSMSRQKVPAEIVAAMGPVEPYKDPKAVCPSCRQMVRLDARKEWIPVSGGGYPKQMKVESAMYYKHRLK